MFKRLPGGGTLHSDLSGVAVVVVMVVVAAVVVVPQFSYRIGELEGRHLLLV